MLHRPGKLNLTKDIFLGWIFSIFELTIFKRLAFYDHGLVIKQQFRADFRIKPDIFSVTSVKNRLE